MNIYYYSQDQASSPRAAKSCERDRHYAYQHGIYIYIYIYIDMCIYLSVPQNGKEGSSKGVSLPTLSWATWASSCCACTV